MADQQPAPRQQLAPRVNGQPDRGSVTGSDTIRDRQRLLVKEGYVLDIDGSDGEKTQEAWRDYQLKQQRRAQVEQQRLERAAEAAREDKRAASAVEKQRAEAATKSAEAQSKAAEARAAEAAAKAKEAEATALATKARADADKRAADATRGAISTPLLAAAILGGTLYGGSKAKALKAEYDAGVAAKNTALAKSASQIEALVSKSEKQKGRARTASLQKIAGHVRAVDAAGLTRARGGVKGAAVAALPFLLEGIVSRGIASQMEEGYTKDLLNEAGTGLMVASGTLLGKRVTSIANAGNPIDAATVGQVNAGRAAAAKQLTVKPVGALPAVRNLLVGPEAPTRARPTQMVPVTTEALKPAAAPLATAANTNVAKATSKLSGKVGGVLGVLGFAAGVLSVVKTARAEGVAAAGKQALEALDPTSGVASKIIDAVATEVKSESSGGIRDLARAQAEERAGLPASTSEQLAQAAAAGYMAPEHAAYASRVAASGLDEFYGSMATPEADARAPYMGLAAGFAREVNGREPADLGLPPTPAAHAAPTIAQGIPALRGWANPDVQAAAQEARRKKGYG